MAFVFSSRCEPQVEERIRAFYRTLAEKHQRRFAAVEALRLGHGGIRDVAGVLECFGGPLNAG